MSGVMWVLGLVVGIVLLAVLVVLIVSSPDILHYRRIRKM